MLILFKSIKKTIYLFNNSGKGLVKSKGTIRLLAEEVSHCNDTLEIAFKAKNLLNAKLIGCLNPFLVFYRKNEDNSLV